MQSDILKQGASMVVLQSGVWMSGCAPAIECCDSFKRGILGVDALWGSYTRHEIIEHILLIQISDAPSARPHAANRWLARPQVLCRRNCVEALGFKGLESRF
jgi:hypothetical protein